MANIALHIFKRCAAGESLGDERGAHLVDTVATRCTKRSANMPAQDAVDAG